MFARKIGMHQWKLFQISLALFVTLASVTLGTMLLLSPHSAVHAAPTVREIFLPAGPTNVGINPWGVAFDNQGNAWIAAPECDPSPVCSIVRSGMIVEVNKASFSVVNTFTEPTDYSSPVFVAVDTQGNIWFTEPMSNAIGELTPNFTDPAASTWHQWTVPTANAAPFDLAFDGQGHLWFTEVLAHAIGEFDLATQQITETPTPSGNSKPYGITGPDPLKGEMWFTENNSTVARIGSFAPPANSALTTGNMKEYLTRSGSTAATPHLITFDANGNIWWTEGMDRNIGRLVINKAKSGTSKGVTEYTVPYPDSACPNANDCAMHISGIGVDGTGTVWFDDSLTARLGSFTPNTGTFSMLPPLGGGFLSNAHPHDGLAVDGNNTIFFTEEFANKLGEVLQGTLPTPMPGTPTGTPTQIPVTSPGPVNTTWYFAEGRVGRGFREYLTIGNPTPATCAVNVQYLYTMDGSSTPTSQSLSFTVSPASRKTESVNTDLGIADSMPTAASLAAIVTVDTTTTPSCPGIVAERPMYFTNYHGISSGSDVLGATQLSSTYYFADVPTGNNFISYITLLNPNSVAATVTASYYVNGNKVQSQTVTVPAKARGTISPNAVSMPAHVAAVISSSQPIVVERPTYFINAITGTGGNISGAYDVVGAPNVAADWLFAEGYTGSGYREYLTLANLDPAKAAAVTITLKSKTGATGSTSINLGPQSQIIWNVNAANTFSGATPEVSTEIVSTGMGIVVQREMYFMYKHTLPQQASSGTDVMGEIGPARHNAYNFSEGYTNSGYNEWLTLQNPTTKNETVYVTLVNGNGQSSTQSFTVTANSRFTQDINALAQQMFHPTTTSGFSVSMTVQTLDGSFFVAERPMYWNTSGTSSFVTQGGSDVIGYSG